VKEKEERVGRKGVGREVRGGQERTGKEKCVCEGRGGDSVMCARGGVIVARC